MDAEALAELTDAGRFRLRGLLDNAKFVCEEPPLPGVTTNQIENVFSQPDLRLKEIGRRWGLTGPTNMIRVLLKKIFRPEFWENHLAFLKGTPGSFLLDAKIIAVEWLS